MCEITNLLWRSFYFRKELWDRLEYADKVGCKNLVLNSNGSLLGKDNNIDNVLNSPLKDLF